MRRRGAALVLILLTALAIPVAAAAAEPCPPDPHPCGDEWPAALEGPFALREVQHIQVPSHDGVLLDGWISFPNLPPGVRAPVVLISTPYLATAMVHPLSGPLVFRNPGSDDEFQGSGGWWDDDAALQFDQGMNGIGVHPIRWIRRGFVLANFSLRGTGHSGGCFDTGGRVEQLDQKALVDWLASQAWSNGRVGMGGLSYPGWTTWQAAVQAPAGLKAIASLAPIVDFYDYAYTPQGARHPGVQFVIPPLYAQYSNPPVLGDPTRIAESTAGRAACENRAETTTQAHAPLLTGVRSRDFFEERDLTPRLDEVRAAVLQVQGFVDPGHVTQDRLLTASLPDGTPFREVRGWWGHVHPSEANPPFVPPPGAGEESWEDIVTGWFEYWLKGRGAMPRLVVDHQDQSGEWFASAAWPPPEAIQESRYLSAGTLTAGPSGDEATFRAAPSPDVVFMSYVFGAGGVAGSSLCAPPVNDVRINAVYESPVASDVVISGNPYLEVTISSDMPAGVVGANLYDLGPDFRCGGGGVPVGARWIAAGGADLEHYNSRYEPVPFPVDAPTTLRIDLSDVTAVIEEGHRIAVVLHHGEFAERMAQPGRYPMITVYPDSRIVLPVIRGVMP